MNFGKELWATISFSETMLSISLDFLIFALGFGGFIFFDKKLRIAASPDKPGNNLLNKK
jgi:hypothetical protein